jgi:hypothetical protein
VATNTHAARHRGERDGPEDRHKRKRRQRSEEFYRSHSRSPPCEHRDRERHLHSDDREHRHRGRDDYNAARRSNNISSHSSREDDKRAAEERSVKLAAMKSNAAPLEQDRNRRLKEIEARDARAKAKGDENRMSGGRRFERTLREQARNVDLGTNAPDSADQARRDSMITSDPLLNRGAPVL